MPLSMDPGRKKGECFHDCALWVHSNVRELAKQGVRLPDQVQGFFLLRRANLSTQARIAIMTLAGNSLSFSDVRKACKRHADEFLRDPKVHDAHMSHTVYVSQAKEARAAAEEQEGDTDVETALAALNENNDTDLRKAMFKRYCWLTRSHHNCVELTVVTACDRGVPVAENLIELRVGSTCRN